MSRVPTCRSNTRPPNPNDGYILFEEDTGQLIIYDGTASAWRAYDYNSIAYSTGGIDELHYSTGIFSDASASYYLNISPTMHFDGKYIDGEDSNNNPANGALVSTWVDRSGNPTNYDLTQSTDSFQAVFDNTTEGQNSLAFNSDSYNTGTTYVGSPGYDYTAVYVAKISGLTNEAISYAPLNGGNNTSTIWFNASSYGDVVHSSTARGFHSGSNDDGTEMPTLFNPLHLFIIQRSFGTVTAYTGGSTQQWSYSSISDAVVINRFGIVDSYVTNGNIFEVMFFDSALSTTNLNVITNYVNNKYGISTTLF